jgi:integrase
MPSVGVSSHSRYRSYLTTHRGILYFRILVPNHLQSLIGKREIRRSLNGLDSRSARTKALRLSLAAQHFFALADDLAHERIHSVQEKAIQLSGITKENIKSVGTFLFDSTLKKDLSPASLTLLLPSFLREQEGIASSTKVFSEKVEAAEAGGAGEERFSLPKEETPSVEPTETVRRRIKLEEKGRLPNLREAFDAYVKAKTLTWSAASAKDIPPQVRQFVEIVRELEHGRDIRVDELSREHIRSYFDTLKHLPCRLCGQRQFTGKGWLQLADMGRSGQIERLLSVKTMEVRQTNVRSFVNWCELEYRGAVQAKYVNSGFPKVLSDKDIRRKGVKREAFTQDELKALFGDMGKYVQATEGVSSRFWAPLIALYSGMRLEEICQLHLSDIVKVDGVLCFSINEESGGSGYVKHVKSSAGIRKVPVHPHLWDELGLKKFVVSRWAKTPEEKYTSTLLFPDLQERVNAVNHATVKLGSALTHWFTRYRRSVGVGGQHGEPSTKAFHSFRHTVIEYLHKEARVDLSMLQAVVGHEMVDMGVTENYAGDWAVKTLLTDVIQKLNWISFFQRNYS